MVSMVSVWTLCSLIWLLLLFTSNSDAVHPSAVYRSFHQNDHFTVPLPNSTLSAKCKAAYDKLRNPDSPSDVTELVAYIDAMGKPQSGVIVGNLAWFGSYAECQNLTRAHYCLASIKINIGSGNESKTLPIQWGLCVPKNCSDDDVTNGLEKILNFTDNVVQFNHQGQFLTGGPPQRSVNCAKPSEYTPGVIATITLCGVILFLCFVGTVLHVISDCMKPTTDSSLSKNDSFMPVKRSHVEYESSLVDSPETSTTHLNSTQSYRSGSSIPLLVYDKQESMEYSLSQIVALRIL